MEINQDLYENEEEFEFRMKITRMISEKIPKLNEGGINVLANAYVKKLKTGEIFSEEIEELIVIFLSKIKQIE
jgi:hypothetical protein